MIFILKNKIYWILTVILVFCIGIITGGLYSTPDPFRDADAIADLAEQSAKSVVSLRISIANKPNIKIISTEQSSTGEKIIRIKPETVVIEKEVGDGSGFIISSDGYIVTNVHVINPEIDGVQAKASKIVAELYNGLRYDAQIIGQDPDSDIAVLKINAKNLKAINWANSDKVRPGQFALTIGCALGAEHTVGFGIISAVSRQKPSINKEALLGGLDYIQTYAQINPGNSGGPLIDMNGDVIGITSFIQIAPHSPGFAIPANYANKVVYDLMHKGYVERPSLGVLLSSSAGELTDSFSLFTKHADILGEEDRGALIKQIIPNSPAYKAGLQPYDLITKINDIAVKSPIQFIRIIRTSPIGTEFTLVIERDNQTLQYKIKTVSNKSI